MTFPRGVDFGHLCERLRKVNSQDDSVHQACLTPARRIHCCRLDGIARVDLFYQTFGFVAAICAGIAILTVFFTAVGYFKRATRGFDVVKMKGFIKDGKLVNVYLSDGKSANCAKKIVTRAR
jgi:hypothetical protein